MYNIFNYRDLCKCFSIELMYFVYLFSRFARNVRDRRSLEQTSLNTCGNDNGIVDIYVEER